MPLASSNDLILAGIKDIVQALHQHPSPGSSLAPLTDSHHQALTDLTSILTSIVTPAAASPPTIVAALPLTDSSLRVSEPPATEPTIATANSDTVRAEENHPALRVPIPARRPKTVAFAPLPAPTTGATFTNSTGTKGKQRRRLRSQSNAPSTTQPTKTVHPKKLLQRVATAHSHGTRSKPLTHIATCARTLLLADARAPQSPFATEPERVHYAYLGHAINPDTGKIAEYRELSKCIDGAIWRNSNAEEIGRLTQGYGTIKGTNTIFFIHPSAMPKGRKAAYLRAVSAYRPEKAQPYRVRWTVGGDQIDCPFNVSTKTADLTTAKLLFNSVLSTPNAIFLTADLKDFYLGTLMSRYEYMRIPIWMLPYDIIDQYNLKPLFHNGFVYVEIRRGMYGLPQAGRLANDQLIKFLAPHGYKPCALTPGLWKHKLVTSHSPLSSTTSEFDIPHAPRRTSHQHTKGRVRSQPRLDWKSLLRFDPRVGLPCPYLRRLHARLHRACPPSFRPEHAPHSWQRPNYGAKTQFAVAPDESPSLDAADKTRILEVLGTLLFYARAIDLTLLTAIGELATEHSQATQTIMEKLA